MLQAISKWETGMALPDITMLVGICNVLELDANMLLGIKAERDAAKTGSFKKGESIQDMIHVKT